jgi:hypothetical protein
MLAMASVLLLAGSPCADAQFVRLESAEQVTVVTGQLLQPTGITADARGNALVHSDAVFSTLVSLLAADGAVLSSVALGGFGVASTGPARLATDPGTGTAFMLTSAGQVLTIDPASLQVQPLVDLATLPLRASDVFDVLSGQRRRLALSGPVLGDLAVLRRGSSLDLLFTGVADAQGGAAFVARVRLGAPVPPVVDVIVTAQGASAPRVLRAPGIAVAADGTVVTVLPFVSDATPRVQGLVTFHADFPEDPSRELPHFIFLNADGVPRAFASQGMTTDASGNFYVATGEGGSECGGAFTRIPASLAEEPQCVRAGPDVVRAEDVAVSPVDGAVLLTTGDLVLGFRGPQTVRIGPPGADIGPAPTGGSSGEPTATGTSARPGLALASAGEGSPLPAYRFFNPLTGTHFYTASEAERTFVSASLPHFRFEGVAYHVFGGPRPGAVPVHRFFNVLTGTHFYTTDEAERDRVIAALPQFRFEGVAYYAFPEVIAGAVAVYRFFNTRTGTHFYTASEAERDLVVAALPHYAFEGVAFYALE